jgi:hypothetical protein
MTEGKKKGFRAILQGGRIERVRFFVSLALSLVLIATCVWYAVSCISIYSADTDTPFTREIVAEQLRILLPISLITVALTVAAGFISIFAKAPKNTVIPIKNKALLRITERKLSTEHLSAAYTEKANAEAKLQRKIVIIFAAASAVIIAAMLVFILNPSRYGKEDPNTDIAYSALIALCGSIVIFGGLYAMDILREASYKRVLTAAREELSRQKSEGVSLTPCENSALGEGHTVLVVRLALIAVAIVFIILGVSNGGMEDVLGKAVRICTECIGLG